MSAQPEVSREAGAGTESYPDDYWTHILRPQGRWFDLRMKELWQYRDLVLLFVRRDFVAQYKQTILGPAWHFMQPLFTTIVFTIIFGKIARISTDGAPPFLFYMAGTTIWSLFSATLNGTAHTFVANASIFGKVYFPRLAIPVSVLISRLIAFVIQFVLFLGFLVYFATTGSVIHITAYALLTPLMLLLTVGIAMGLGIIVSAMTTKYRDLAVLVGFGVQLMMFATPVIYPVSVIPEPYQFWMALNPLAHVVEFFRYAYLGVGTVTWAGLAYSTAMTLLILLVGIAMFNRVERTFMDTV